MSTRIATLLLVLLLELCFSFATWLQPREASLIGKAENGDIMQIVLGDGRRMFANHFFVKADVYFHRGYYPDFMQQSYSSAPVDVHIAERHDNPQDEHPEDEKAVDFLGKPKNWVDRFGRNFFPSHHSHRDQPGEAREILPWLRLSADLDPHRVETYTVGAYWLISNMKKVDEAEQFLREGLRENPDSYEILFDLGKLYDENRRDPVRARNIWELARRRWLEREERGAEADPMMYDAILAHLARLEENQGDLGAALEFLEEEQDVAPMPESIQESIAGLKQKMAAGKK